MKTVSSEYAAQHLEALLAEVAAGEEIQIEAGGTPVARLVPTAKRSVQTEGDHAETPAEEVEQAFHGD
ncbi:MAG: type II toxin-antitoxin system prevent-host-death family antitoxin [Chromatiaceae bacterium]|nr:type II toxin-antitoxin system prevent-host-death family antitoxin [Chromatiaceae bacterium]